MSSVFISYSSQDYKTAARIRTSLTNRGVRVTIDRHDLTGNIDEFIQNAIRDNAYTLTIISERSLASAWVGQESMTTIYGEKFQQERKYIACYLDEDFLQDDCITRAGQSINSRIKKLESEIKKAQRLGVYPTNLENKKKRLFNLRSNLGDILERLNNDLVYDVREPKYEESIAKILAIVSAGLLSPDATRQKELAYLDKLEQEGIEDRTKYTPLGGRATQIPSIRDEFDLRPCEKIDVGCATGRQLEPRRFDDAVGEILKLNRAVVLGEPGAGKTTTLWKLVGDLSEKSRQDARAPLPLMIRLGKWTKEEELFEAFLKGQLGDLADQLDQLVDMNRVVLLLDGLNEIPAGQRKGKTEQLRTYIQDPKRSKTTVIISCRQLDYTQNELEMDRVEIVPLDPVRIREFVGRYLGEGTGEQLFWRLAGKEAQSTCQTFQQIFGEDLSNWETVFWNAADLPSGTTWGWNNTIWNNWLKVREHPSSLMVLARNPFMLMLLYSVFEENANTLPDNRSGLFDLFIKQLFKREKIDTGDRQLLLGGLSRLAFEMQTRRTSQNDVDALTVLPREEAAGMLDDRLITLATRASILSPGEEVRFTHQLLQEYFAARRLDQVIKNDQLSAASLWPPERWWERNNWEETTVLLAGIYSDNCTPILDWVADANPEVAAMCIKKSGAACPPETLERLKQSWLPRLTGLHRDPDPRARAAVGRALGMTGLDDRPGVGTILGSKGRMIPHICWIEIPGGEFIEFIYGEKEQSDNPPRRMSLAGFKISKYPITYRQFQAFIDDPEGLRDPRWFEGLAGDERERQPGEQAFPFDNHPRENVSWYQAIAFCRWLSWQQDGPYDLRSVAEWEVRLPTEFEWERAARGTAGCSYAYGDKFDSSRANTGWEIRQTSAVGSYPHGSTLEGIADMTGNVWEWCLGTYKNPQIDPAVEDLATSDNRLVRGGSWNNYQDSARAACRDNTHPAFRFNDVGFRVVCGVRPPSRNP